MTSPQTVVISFECFDCGKAYSYASDIKSSTDASELMVQDIENEEIDKKITEIESNPEFNLKSNICLNCIDRYVKLTKKNHQSISNEKELIIQAMKNLLIDINSKELVDIKDNSSIALLQKKQSELSLIKQEQKKHSKATTDLTQQLNKLIKEEEDLWNEITNINIQNEDNALEDLMDNIHYNHIKKKADSLLNPILLSDLFKIEIKNKCAFINDFALDQSKFNINEINFSIGQLAYLISIMNDKVGYCNNIYSIYSIGKRSRILDKGQKKVFDLFLLSNSNQDIALFNEHLKIFISAVIELVTYINDNYKMGFEIIEGNDLNAFRFSMNSLANWSIAMSNLFETIKKIIEEPKLQHVFNTQFK